MNNFIRFFTGCIVVIALTPSASYAQVCIPPACVPPPPPTNEWTASVDVPNSCTAIDTASVSHTYSGQYLAICALEKAIGSGAITSVSLSNQYPSFGLFVTGINGIIADSNSQYWALYLNNAYANTGLTQLEVVAGNTIVLELHDFSDVFQNSRLTLTINSLISTSPAVSTGGGMTLHDPFSIPRAVVYLWDRQQANGSFGNEILNDWVAIASAGGSAGDIRKGLIEFERTHTPTLTSITDYERHAMALQALGINPYDGTPADYITPIVNAFDGIQVADKSLINDDIFAIFPLLHAGYTSGDTMLQTIATFIVANQKQDGSWASSVDMTAAGIQALMLMQNVPGAPEAVTKAIAYLDTAQAKDGGFGNSQSTSWALQAIWAKKQTTYDWVKAIYYTPDYYLAAKQSIDGGVEPTTSDEQTRMWATAYAIPAIERKTWDDLLSNFQKPLPVIAETLTPIVATPAEEDQIVLGTPSQQVFTVESQVEQTRAPQAEEQIPATTATESSTDESQTGQLAAAGATDIDWEAMWLLLALLLIAGGTIWVFEKELV